MNYQALNPAGDPDQILFVYSTDAGSDDETALRLLANWRDAGTGRAGAARTAH